MIWDETGTDRRVVQCNFVEGTRTVAAGSRAYVVRLNNGNGNDRIVVLARSRGGRWIETWATTSRLGNFRIKTLPPEHPMYGRDLCPVEVAAEFLTRIGATQGETAREPRSTTHNSG